MSVRTLTAGAAAAVLLTAVSPASAATVTYDRNAGQFTLDRVTKPAAAPLLIETVAPMAGLTFVASNGTTATTNAAGIAVFQTLREPGQVYSVSGPNGGTLTVTNLGV